MSADAFKLLERLEAEWIDPLTAAEDDIEGLLGRRQEILVQLQSLDTPELGTEVRAQLAERMRAIVTRDMALVASLQERMEIIDEQLGKAVQGRAAVRGYRAPEDGEAKILIRPA
jgi:hypothetical protein